MNTNEITENNNDLCRDFSPYKSQVMMEFDPCQEKNSKTLESELESCIQSLANSADAERIKLLKTQISLKFKSKDTTPDAKLGFELKDYIFKIDKDALHLLVALISCMKGQDIKWLSRLNITSDDQVKALHKVIEVKADAGDYEQCQEWLQQAKFNKLPLEDVHRPGTMLFLLKQALKIDKIDKVIALFINDTETEANYVHAIVDYILFKQSAKEYKVLELQRKLRNNKVDKNTHSIIIRAQAKSFKIKEAITLLKELISQGNIPDEIVFNTLLDGCSKNEMIKEIEVVIKLMNKSGIAPGTVSYNSIIDGQVRCKEFWKAWDCQKEMQNKHIKADNFTYSSLIKGVVGKEQRKEFGIITKLFDKIKLSDKPDEILYNCMIDSCVATNHFDLAQGYFQEMKAHATIKPDLITYNTLIKGCALNLDQDTGLQLIDDIKSRNDLMMNAITFNTLIDLFVRVNNMDQAQALLEDMSTNGSLKPDSFTQSTLMKGIKKNVKRLPKERTIEQCFGQVQDLITRKVEIDDVLFNCLIDVCIHYKDMDRAIDAYNRMVQEKIQPKTITFGILIKGQGMNGQIDKAFDIFEKQLIDYKLGVNEVTQGTLLDCCVKNHDLNRARQVQDRMRNDSNIKSNTILNTTVIKMFNLEKNLKAAQELFETMLKSKYSYPNNVTFNTMLDTAIKCDDLALAEHQIKMMPECGFKPDLITYSTLAKGQIQSHQVTKAQELIKEMKRYNIRPDEHFLTTLFDGCSKEGDFQLVMKILLEIKTLKIRLSNYIFLSLVKLHAKMDQMGDFPLLIDAMKALHVTPNAHVYGVILSHCLQTSDPSISQKCFNSMLSDQVLCEAQQLTSLVKQLKNAQWWFEALEVSMVCLDNGCAIDSALLSEIIVNCPEIDMSYLTEIKILLEKLNINLSDKAAEVFNREVVNINEKTPFESRVSSRFLSHTKSTQDKTFDTNSMKKNNKKFQSNNKHVEKLDLEKDI